MVKKSSLDTKIVCANDFSTQIESPFTTNVEQFGQQIGVFLLLGIMVMVILLNCQKYILYDFCMIIIISEDFWFFCGSLLRTRECFFKSNSQCLISSTLLEQSDTSREHFGPLGTCVLWCLLLMKRKQLNLIAQYQKIY